MTNWSALEQELAHWQQAGARATLWWRDDDVVEPTDALAQLLDLAAANDQPLALAVIPQQASRDLPPYLETATARITLLQHGYAHRNHAPDGEKKVELGSHRPVAAVCEDLTKGAALLDRLFPDSTPATGSGLPRRPARLPVLVPPWNRIAPAIVDTLPALGFTGLSSFAPRATPSPAPGLRQVNCHVDIMRWHAPRGFAGEAACLEALVDHLRCRRQGAADRAEPTGLLTHHLAHDAEAWAFLERLLPVLAKQAAIRIIGVAEAFAHENENAEGSEA